MATTRRYPLEPLAQTLGITLHTNGGHQPEDELDTLADLADRLNITHRHARRLLAHGLTESQADNFAIRLDYHPANIWTDWYHHP